MIGFDEHLRTSLRRQKFNGRAVPWHDVLVYDSKLARIPLGDCRPYAERTTAPDEERPQIMPNPTRN